MKMARITKSAETRVEIVGFNNKQREFPPSSGIQRLNLRNCDFHLLGRRPWRFARGQSREPYSPLPILLFSNSEARPGCFESMRRKANTRKWSCCADGQLPLAYVPFPNSRPAWRYRGLLHGQPR